MKRIIVLPTEGYIQIIIETEIDKEEVEAMDCVICSKEETLEMIKQELEKNGIYA